MTNEKEQTEFCNILDRWYVNCKEQFEGVHPLGMRKEDLKIIVCDWISSKKFIDKQEFDRKFELLIQIILKNMSKDQQINFLFALLKLNFDEMEDEK